jgi:hypothetical protein
VTWENVILEVAEIDRWRLDGGEPAAMVGKALNPPDPELEWASLYLLEWDGDRPVQTPTALALKPYAAH